MGLRWGRSTLERNWLLAGGYLAVWDCRSHEQLSWAKKKKKGIFYKVRKENIKCGISSRRTPQDSRWLTFLRARAPLGGGGGWGPPLRWRHVCAWRSELPSVPEPPVTALRADRRKPRMNLPGDLPLRLWGRLCLQVSHRRRAGWGWLCPHAAQCWELHFSGGDRAWMLGRVSSFWDFQSWNNCHRCFHVYIAVVIQCIG